VGGFIAVAVSFEALTRGNIGHDEQAYDTTLYLLPPTVLVLKRLTPRYGKDRQGLDACGVCICEGVSFEGESTPAAKNSRVR
jgi:hypothetical protein